MKYIIPFIFIFLFVSCSEEGVVCGNTIVYDKRCAKLRDEALAGSGSGWQAQCEALPPPNRDDVVCIIGSPSSNAICDTFLPAPKKIFPEQCQIRLTTATFNAFIKPFFGRPKTKKDLVHERFQRTLNNK